MFPREQLLARQQDLVGGLAAPALAAHAVGDQGEQAAGHPLVRQDLDLILLVHPVAAVKACCCREAVAGDGLRHGRKL